MDTEKVVSGLEYTWEYIRERPNPTAPPKARAMNGIMEAIKLLKEQKAVEPTFRQDEDGVFVWACGSCGAYMYHIYDGIDKAKEYVKYCRQCGKKVKWND